MLEKNKVKLKLKRGELCLSAMFPFYSPPLVELLGRCGTDAITFDSEHGSLDISQIEDLARACELVGVTPLCRVPAGRQEIILRTLDAGVMGVIVPHVKTRDDAEEIVSSVKYPPWGRRGMAMTARAPGYMGMSVDDYITQANNETMVIVQIEDPEGVENVESIVSVKGLDGVFIGRNDLTLAMGFTGNVSAPEVQKAIEKVASMTLKAGLTLVVATDEREGPSWIKRGARLLSIHIVPYIRRKWSEGMKELRHSIEL